MAEITTYAYEDLRAYIEANWTYISLYDNGGTPAEVLRLPVSDARVTWTHTAGAATLELTIVITGADAEISASLPKTFASSRIFKVSSGGNSFSTETFSAFTIQTSSDQLTVKHRIEVPDQP